MLWTAKQILAYDIHVLDQRTPFTLFTVQWDYNFIHSFDIITCQNKIGILNVCPLNKGNDIFEHKCICVPWKKTVI